MESYHVVDFGTGVRLLKVAVIYGANASGKSNIIKVCDPSQAESGRSVPTAAVKLFPVGDPSRVVLGDDAPRRGMFSVVHTRSQHLVVDSLGECLHSLFLGLFGQLVLVGLHVFFLSHLSLILAKGMDFLRNLKTAPASILTVPCRKTPRHGTSWTDEAMQLVWELKNYTNDLGVFTDCLQRSERSIRYKVEGTAP